MDQMNANNVIKLEDCRGKATAAYASEGCSEEDLAKSGTGTKRGRDWGKTHSFSRLKSEEENRNDSSVKQVTPLFNSNS